MKHLKGFNQITKIFEADNVDFALTEVNQKAGELRKEMLKHGLKIHVKVNDKTFKYEPESSDSKDPWSTKKTVESHDSFLVVGQKSIHIGIGKETKKAPEILKYVEENFKDFDIQKKQSAEYWEILIKK
jgi:hypothetical protein